jgi:digeranylgeranylglycerophospholipid reductase
LGRIGMEFDAVVVGAGPAGSLVAEGLARASLRVALLEEHPQAGLPNHCSGLVSPRTLAAAGVAEEEVGLARYTRARVWGPGGGTLWLRSGSVQAVAIDRPRFDRILAERAAGAGAELMVGTRACGFERVAGGVRVAARAGGKTLHLRARLLVGADGASSGVARWMGRGRAHEVIPAAKAEIAFRGRGVESIEIFLGSGLAPGWFGWVIPLPDGTARIGVGATRSLRRSFEALLDLVRERCGDFTVQGTRQAPLPLGPARGFVGDGVMLVGAAARQTKPTTGGGLWRAGGAPGGRGRGGGAGAGRLLPPGAGGLRAGLAARRGAGAGGRAVAAAGVPARARRRARPDRPAAQPSPGAGLDLPPGRHGLPVPAVRAPGGGWRAEGARAGSRREGDGGRTARRPAGVRGTG